MATGEQGLQRKPGAWVNSRLWGAALGLLSLCAFILMECTALNRWRTGHWYLADVGNIQQTLFNTWHGRFMWSPLDEGNFFAFHFSPFLLLLSPVTLLSAYPLPLVTLYVLALALTPVPIYLLARRFGLPPYCGVALGAWFLGNHFTGSLELSYHFESFYVLFALCLLASLGSPRRFWWPVCAVLVLAVKEDAAVWLAGLCVWYYLIGRRDGDLAFPPQRAGRLLLLCVVWAIAAGAVIALCASGTTHNASKYVERMSGVSVGADNLAVLGMLVLSSAGICLFNWRAALLLLVPLPVILGNFHFTRHLLYYYSYPFLPYLAYATIAGAAVVYRFCARRGLAQAGGIALTVIMIAAGAAQYFLPTRTDGMTRLSLAETLLHLKHREVAATKLPPQAPVALQFGLWGITPSRADAVLLKPGQVNDQHYLFFNPKGQFGLSREDHAALGELLTRDTESGRRRELYNNHGLVILSPAGKEEGGERKP